MRTLRKTGIMLAATALITGCSADESGDALDAADTTPGADTAQALDTAAAIDAIDATYDIDDADSATTPDTDVQWCSLDCWPKLSCSDGTVTAAPGAFWDGPCDEQPSGCPSAYQSYTCQAGCGLWTECMDPSWPDLSDLSAYCAENQPRLPGDPCTTDADCTWSCLPLGAPHVPYQRCDTSLEAPRCVTTAPPTAPTDLGQPCFLGGSTGWVTATPTPSLLLTQTTCASEICVVARDASCLYDVCTATCETDDDCPTDWACEATPRELGDPVTACVPATLHTSEPSLPCDGNE